MAANPDGCGGRAEPAAAEEEEEEEERRLQPQKGLLRDDKDRVRPIDCTCNVDKLTKLIAPACKCHFRMNDCIVQNCESPPKRKEEAQLSNSSDPKFKSGAASFSCGNATAVAPQENPNLSDPGHRSTDKKGSRACGYVCGWYYYRMGEIEWAKASDVSVPVFTCTMLSHLTTSSHSIFDAAKAYGYNYAVLFIISPLSRTVFHSLQWCGLRGGDMQGEVVCRVRWTLKARILGRCCFLPLAGGARGLEGLNHDGQNVANGTTT
ncbi:hypothetical protein IF2G_05328 [Cordyceps javanica]|nr:hypothetical protein IF2G_05328 [Cordyceps javanica]